MKTYQELSEKQKAQAFEAAINRLLTKICEGTVKFNDKNVQSKIEDARNASERMHTPWFMHELVMEHCKDEVQRAAKTDLERAFYREPGDVVISL